MLSVVIYRTLIGRRVDVRIALRTTGTYALLTQPLFQRSVMQ